MTIIPHQPTAHDTTAEHAIGLDSVYQRVTDDDRALARGLLSGDLDGQGHPTSRSYWLGRLSALLDSYVEAYAAYPRIQADRDEYARLTYAVFELLVMPEVTR